MGGLRFEDYKVTNPRAIQFDPLTRSAELAQVGSAAAQLMSKAPPAFTSPAPTVTFGNVQAQIWYDGVGQSLDVQFDTFTASNGYASPSFGFTMKRGFNGDGTVQSQYRVYLNSANPPLQKVAGLEAVGFTIDPVARAALLFGTVPSSAPLRQAIFGLLTHLQSILNAAKFTTTAQPPSGKSLWTVPEIMSLVGEAQALIAATADDAIPIGPPYKCTYPTVPNAYAVCSGSDQMAAFENMVMRWGGEYLGLGTSQSRQILTKNLLAWAQANAPVLDPAANDLNHAFEYANMELSKPILMVWPTLRDDPLLPASDRQTIENWIVNKLMPVAYIPGGVGGAYPYTNNWGYFGASVQMADAIRRSDHLTFANAIQEFYVALNQMRPDGSFPLETNRGACSGTYSNVNILHLTSIAEMAASQGYDLYSWNVNGKNLELAIEFLLNARENPALIAQYSKSSTDVCFSTQPPDQPDIQSVFNTSVPNQAAWMEGYIARFPFSTTAARLRQIFGSNIAAAPFPMLYSYVGLNSTAAFRKPYEFQPVDGITVAIISGYGQTVTTNQPAPAPLAVRVTDNSGRALAGALVSFAVVQGSANVAAPAQVVTDANGIASANVTIGPVGGPVTVTATALGVPTIILLTDRQNDPGCTYALDYSGQGFEARGGTGTITITTGANCPWSVGVLPTGITLTSTSSGVGSGSITFQVLPNLGGSVTNSFTIADQNFSIEQSAASIAGLTGAGSLGQVASEGTWDFSLVGVNLGASAATARFTFLDNNGAPLALPLTFPQTPPRSGALLAAILDRTLAPNAQVVMNSSGPDSAPTLIGSGQLASNGNVSGFGVFANPKLKWNAVVPLETRNATKYLLAFDNTLPLTTGVAVANLASQAANVPVIIRDGAGQKIGNSTISLSALGHTSFMLNDPQLGFPVTNGERGTIEFDTPSGGQISVLGLRANGPALTTLPVLANVGAGGGSITHVAYNGGWTSVFYLVNTDNASAEFTLSFFDENGLALPVPLQLPQSGTNITTATLTQTLAAGAMLVVDTQTEDGKALVVGSAQLTTSGGVSGFEIFRWTTFGQEASVPLESRTPNSFVLLFDDTNGLTTGVALANQKAAAVNVTVRIYDDAGTLLQTTTINLGSGGHTSFMLPDNYSATANKRGMIEFVLPPAAKISALGLRAKNDGTLTTIPVLTK
jgi:hypothetical protein